MFKVAQTKTGLNIWEFDIQNKQVIGNPDSAVIRSYQNLTANIPESIIAQGLIHPQSINELKNLYQRLKKELLPFLLQSGSNKKMRKINIFGKK